MAWLPYRQQISGRERLFSVPRAGRLENPVPSVDAG
jgi:hypothetical protein